MGANCAPLLADLFLYSYENECLDRLVKESKKKLARKFNLLYHFIDDIVFNNNKFKEFISEICPKQLTIPTPQSDKRDDFSLHFPFMQATFDQGPVSTGLSSSDKHS